MCINIYIYTHTYMSSSMQHEFSPGRRQLPRLHLPCTTQAPQTRAQDGTDEDWCGYCLLCTSRYFILLYYPSVKHIRTQSERQREVRQIQTEFGCDFLLGPDARREAYSHGPCLPMLPKSRTAGLRKSNSLQNIRLYTRSQNGKKPGRIAELGRPAKQAFD